MSNETPKPRAQDDLTALIDLLAIEDTTSPENVSSQAVNDVNAARPRYVTAPSSSGKRVPHANKQDDYDSPQVSSTSRMPSFNPAELAMLGPNRQSTPLPGVAAGAGGRENSASTSAFSPQMGDLVLDVFPPLSPRIQAVKSLANISVTAAAAFALSDSPLPSALTPILPLVSVAATVATTPIDTADVPRSKALANLTGADLLPVSPFLLSPTDPVGLDISRSPFFAQRPSNKHSPPIGITNGITRAPINSHTHERSGSGSAMDRLADDLSKAQAELAAVRHEYTQLRDIVVANFPHARLLTDGRASVVQDGIGTTDLASYQIAERHRRGKASALNGVAVGSSPRAEDAARTHLREGRVKSPPKIVSSARNERIEESNTHLANDSLDGMSGEAAKQKLRDIMAFLQLPGSALDTIPQRTKDSDQISDRLATNPPEVDPMHGSLLPSPLPHSPIQQAIKTPSPAVLLSSVHALKSFADVKRALDFLQQIDELVWQRSLLASYGVRTTKNNGGTHYSRKTRTKSGRLVGPEDFLLLRDGSKVEPSAVDDGDDEDEKEEEANEEEEVVFEEMNVRALLERIELWESVVRNRPGGLNRSSVQ